MHFPSGNESSTCPWLSKRQWVSYVVELYISKANVDIFRTLGGSWPLPDCEQLSFLLVLVIVNGILADFLHILLQHNSLRIHLKEACIGCKLQALLQYTHHPCGPCLSKYANHSATVSEMDGGSLPFAMVCLMYARASHALTAHCHIRKLWKPWSIVG